MTPGWTAGRLDVMGRMRREDSRRVAVAFTVLASVIAGAVPGIAAPSSAPVVAQAPAPQVVVKDPANRFTIMVPRTWSFQTSTSGRAPAVAAKAPAASGQLPDSVDVITQDLPTAIDPVSCGEKMAMVMRFTIKNWTTLKEGAATFVGKPAYSRIYTWHTSTGQDRRSEQTCVTLGRRAFVVVATTANDERSIQQDVPQLERIAATFQPNEAILPGPVERPSSTHN